ncbi:calmodulin-binding transcription activator 1, partial [Plakobranchus ocellatus]
HLSLSQESHQTGKPSQYLQQTQPTSLQHQVHDDRESQLLLNTQAAQNQTNCLDSKAEGRSGSAPVLTLHLKPTNSSTSDSPGFVLSLQGATIVSQHSGMPNTMSGSGRSNKTGPCNSNQNIASHSGLVLAASQSPGGSLVLNKISSEPVVPVLSAHSQQGLFDSHLNTAPGAPSSCFAVSNNNSVLGTPHFSQGRGVHNLALSVGGSTSSLNNGTAQNLHAGSTPCNTDRAISLGANNESISKNLLFCTSSNIVSSNQIDHNIATAQTLPFDISSKGDNKLQVNASFSPIHEAKDVAHVSPNQNSGFSSNIININQKNLLSTKAIPSIPVISPNFSQQRPSQTQPFVYSSPTTTVMEGVQVHNHSNHSHKSNQFPQQHNVQNYRDQQQRFETISPPTVINTSSQKVDNVFSAKGPDILNTFDGINTVKNMEGKPHHTTLCTSSEQALVTSHMQPEFGCHAVSSLEEQSSKRDTLRDPVFSLHHQLQQPQNLHQHLHNPQASTSDLMASQARLPSSLKDSITNQSSCDTLEGSFSSLPSADLNLDELLDLNDLGDVADLGCSPFTPPDLTQQTADMDKDTIEEEVSNGSRTVLENNAVSHSANSTLFCCTSTHMSYNHLLQHQHQHHHQHQQLHLAVPQPLSQHDDKNAHGEAPSSPLHPGAPPYPLTSFTCTSAMSSSLKNDREGTVLSEHSSQTRDPEINSVIKDFSPGWAYIKTNTKVLVAGPWRSETSHYSCVFDGEHIPAMLIQPGLLRCYTQYHNAGYATLQVARDGIIISNCEVFEFCDKTSSDVNTCHPEWFAFDVTQLKLLLVERLDQFCRRFVTVQNHGGQNSLPDDMEELESSLVQQVQNISSQQQLPHIQEFPKAGQHNLTLLHLAAGLGFAKLISCLIRWRLASDCVALEFDIDAQSVDSHSCTPLTWACALGNIDAALTLYHWNAVPLKMCNKDGLLPLTIARQKGHYNLARQVEQLELAKEQEEQHRQELAASNMDLSCSPGPSGSESTPSTVTTDLRSCSAAGDDMGSVGSMADAACSEKDGAEMKDELGEVSVESLPPQPSPFSKPGKPGPKLIRRFSEQVMGSPSKPLSKRNSVDLLPSGQSLDQASLPGMGSPAASPSMAGNPLRESSSESQLLHAIEGEEREEEAVGISGGICSPDMTDMAFVVPPAPRLMLEEKLDEPSGYPVEDEVVAEESPQGDIVASKMDTDELVLQTTDSPIIDVERISSDEEVEANKDGSKHQMVTLANQIIAAIPERIKLSPSKGDDVDETLIVRGRTESHSSLPSQGSPRLSSFGDDSGISTPMTDSLAFDEYRYPELGTPSSSLSPDSTCLPSPYSPYSFTLDSPPPTTAEFTEYFNAPTTYMEKDFSQLTLSDQEQRKLYEAAKVIQNAYRHYRDKQQQKEIEAAILIQSYYRRYKTYAYYKKMSQAAVLIQNQFRTYYARRKKRGDLGAVSRRDSERLKKGRNQSVIIQQRFRSHYQRRSFEGKEGSGQASGSGDGPDSSPARAEGRSSPCRDATPPTDADTDSQPRELMLSADSSTSTGFPGDSASSQAGSGGKGESRKRSSSSLRRRKAQAGTAGTLTEKKGESKRSASSRMDNSPCTSNQDSASSAGSCKNSTARVCADKERREEEEKKEEDESCDMLNVCG